MNAAVGDFLKHVMAINVMTMGSAAAGIIGSAGPGADTVDSLKRTAIKFANEYSKPAPNEDELKDLEQAIIGYLKTLQLTYTLSESSADALIAEVQTLVPPESER